MPAHPTTPPDSAAGLTPGELAAEITATEHRLTELRSIRDEQIKAAHQAGTSKYRLARTWGITETTVTRILSA